MQTRRLLGLRHRVAALLKAWFVLKRSLLSPALPATATASSVRRASAPAAAIAVAVAVRHFTLRTRGMQQLSSAYHALAFAKLRHG